MRHLSRCVCVAVMATATEAAAQAAQSYTYDANGRLVGVSTTGPAGSNTASYTYDDANNRTLRGQGGVSYWAALRRLPADSPLPPHQALTSPDGTWSLAFRSSGRLELWSAETPLPSDLAAMFEVSTDGDARFLPPSGLATTEARLELASDGSLLMLDRADQVLWRSDAATAGEDGQ
jgi:glucose/arabinose dehydrogenase